MKGYIPLIILGFFSSVAQADSIIDFYSRNSAKTTYAPSPEVAEIGTVSTEPSKSIATSALKSEKDLVNTYGNPFAELPINSQDNAPLPFKGMMAALEAGNADLAKAYAKQYVWYVKNLKQRTNAAIQFIEAAEKDLGATKGGDDE